MKLLIVILIIISSHLCEIENTKDINTLILNIILILGLLVILCNEKIPQIIEKDKFKD